MVKEKKKKDEKIEIVNEEQKEEKKNNKKKIFIIIGIIILLIILFLIWWFNRKFDVTFKYNNGDPDYTVKVKYLNKIKEEDVKEDIVKKESSFVGYFESYYLSSKEIETLNSNTSDASNICKDGFEISNDKDRCISKTEFDFKNTKIKENKIIEALWSSISFDINPKNKTINEGESFKITATVTGSSDKTVKWSSNNSKIAKVDSSGKVTGVKKGTTIIQAESNGIKRTCSVTVKEVKKVEKDTGKIALSSSKKCIIGNDSVKISANITGNALNKTIKWTYPSCYSIQNTSDTVKTLTRKSGCSNTQELNANVSAKLNNGSSSSTSFKYEPQLTFKVYNNGREISPSSNGGYYGSYIKIQTNMNASFSGNYITSTTSNSVSLDSAATTLITIKTPCGQTKTVQIYAVIN